MTKPTYYEYLDTAKLLAEYPLDLAGVYTAMSPEQLRALQNERFLRCVDTAWRTPFYRRLWGAAGIERGDIASLDDLGRLPTYDKNDLMASVELHPPFGDYGTLVDTPSARIPPVIMHTTSGTTGRPQPLPFGPWSREVQNLLVGRMYRAQGVGDDDIVHSVYGHGLINGGHYLREAVTKFTTALFLSAGTGNETRSERQVEVMRDFGVTTLIGFSDYLRKLASVAVEKGLVPGVDIRVKRIIAHFGAEDRGPIAEAWGANADHAVETFDWYGVGDTGCIAGEIPGSDGMMVWGDAHLTEILDIDTGEAVATGERGDLVVTCLFKDDCYPIIRFNTHDVFAHRTGSAANGLPFQRLSGFLGRSDNMVKLKGINVFPHAFGGILDGLGDADLLGEFVCVLTNDVTGQDSLAVQVEHRSPSSGTPSRYEAVFASRLGVKVNVELVAGGATATLTEVERRQKPIRLIDRRS
jgi:phenylacetate-CoA ligase